MLVSGNEAFLEFMCKGGIYVQIDYFGNLCAKPPPPKHLNTNWLIDGL